MTILLPCARCCAPAAPAPPADDCCPIMIASVEVTPPLAFVVDPFAWIIIPRPENFGALLNGGPPLPFGPVSPIDGWAFPVSDSVGFFLSSPVGPVAGDTLTVDPPAATWLTAAFVPAGGSIWTIALATGGPGIVGPAMVRVRWKGQDGILFVTPVAVPVP